MKPDKSDMPLIVEADKGHFDSVERNICAAAAAAGRMQTAQSGVLLRYRQPRSATRRRRSLMGEEGRNGQWFPAWAHKRPRR
ncbi:hypothetical protein EMEDMD4_1080006 [Sinorhizobium medicae]|uniref:Uncharacterized protein n=1 Tax=Sinorhizobium medicae TaxID=110321 RepID=A0A508WPI9_9HYPH|nr:hypothetical protein EMEDMD4_1080006 [Sinorhizobium medicae]